MSEGTTYVTAKCIACASTRKIYAGEVGANDMPVCEECGSIMIAYKAVRTGRTTMMRSRKKEGSTNDT